MVMLKCLHTYIILLVLSKYTNSRQTGIVVHELLRFSALLPVAEFAPYMAKLVSDVGRATIWHTCTNNCGQQHNRG